jgi:hypothetical protein
MPKELPVDTTPPPVKATAVRYSDLEFYEIKVFLFLLRGLSSKDPTWEQICCLCYGSLGNLADLWSTATTAIQSSLHCPGSRVPASRIDRL